MNTNPSFSSTLVLAGGSGFIGSYITQYFTERNYKIVVLTRQAVYASPQAAIEYVHWDGENVGDWQRYMENAAAIINLSGKSVAALHTPSVRKEIVSSRVRSVRAVGEAIARCQQPPPLWVQASAVGYYGNTAATCTEDSPAGSTFLAQVCQQWETAFAAQTLPTVRPVLLRLGIALERGGGALQPLIKATRLFAGGAAGSGEQYMPWFHAEDLCRFIEIALQNAAIKGAYNICAPEVPTNAEFMKTLRQQLHRPWSPAVPTVILRLAAPLLMNAEPSVILEGCRAVPHRLQELGFSFKYPTLATALKAIFS